MSSLRHIGEFGLIDRLRPLLFKNDSVIEGAGDDCAVLRVGEATLLVSCDMFLEGTHFLRDRQPPRDIGWKAAASCLSDIAAMGGRPVATVVSMAAPGDTAAEFVEGLYQGMNEALARFETALAGGDTARSPRGLLLDVTILGVPSRDRCLLRRGAEPGDLFCVTGWPGWSAAGLHALDNGNEAPELVRAHCRPMPRVAEGQWLCARPEVKAMIDVSDGLLADGGHIAEASGLGLDIGRDAVPRDETLACYCDAHGLAHHDLALAGGEDYELAFAVREDGWPALQAAFRQRYDLPVTAVGRFQEDWRGVRIDGQTPDRAGFDHFGQDPPGARRGRTRDPKPDVPGSRLTRHALHPEGT